MNHYGTLRDFRFSEKDVDDIRDSDLYGRGDEKLGEIDDVIFDHTTGDIRYVVVDTGGWLSSKKFLVPAGRLEASREHDDDYYVNLSKAEIESFPEYDEDIVSDRDRWNDYETRYTRAWSDGEVMHREEEVDKIVTPTTSEMPTATPGMARTTSSVPTGATDVTPMRTTIARENPPVANDPIASGGGVVSRERLGHRWGSFEDRLRRDRSRITSGCSACGISPSASIPKRDRDRKVG
ncbi:MAG TPA: PRC-barrel domain-containing protein [Terriglobales bacterium]|nr:PRC-barrel domain-containing protein [Terriglobales bacterium]